MIWYSTLDLAQQGFVKDPCSVLHGTTKSSGLFDKDDDVTLFTSTIDETDKSTANDLFEVLESEGSFSDESMTLADDLDWNATGLDMDVFTDLTEFMPEVTETEVSVISSSESSVVCQAVANKRKASSELDHGNYSAKQVKLSNAAAEARIVDKTRGEKYVVRRIKNNVASKRSRETRKEKFTVKEKRAKDLELENEQLKVEIEEMEKLAKDMKAVLIQYMLSKK